MLQKPMNSKAKRRSVHRALLLMHSEQSECELYGCPSYRKPKQHTAQVLSSLAATTWRSELERMQCRRRIAGRHFWAASTRKVKCNVGCELLKHLRAYGNDEIQQKTLRRLRCTSCPWPCPNCSPRTPP